MWPNQKTRAHNSSLSWMTNISSYCPDSRKSVYKTLNIWLSCIQQYISWNNKPMYGMLHYGQLNIFNSAYVKISPKVSLSWLNNNSWPQKKEKKNNMDGRILQVSLCVRHKEVLLSWLHNNFWPKKLEKKHLSL